VNYGLFFFGETTGQPKKNKEEITMEKMEVDIQKKEDGSWFFDMAAAVKHLHDGDLNIIRSEMKDAIETEKKKLFPSGDGNGILETVHGSVVDTSFFDRKGYGARRQGLLKGHEVSRMLRGNGGPFIELSPAMQKFADFIQLGYKCQGNYSKMAAKGFDLQDFNTEMTEWNAKAGPGVSLTSTDVGAIVPIEFMGIVIEFAIQLSEILPKLWRIPMGSATTRIPQLSQTPDSYFGGIILYHPAEGAEKVTTKPGFTYREFKASKLIGLVPLTDELIMDSSIAIINYITGIVTRAFQYRTEFEVIQGNGQAHEQLLGITNDPVIEANAVTRKTAGTLTKTDVLKLESAIDENIQDLSYLARRESINILRDERSTTGLPIYYDGTVAGLGERMGPSLNGYPVIRTRNVPKVGHQGDLICGDLGYYIWALRQDMTIDISKERWFEYDITALRFVMRQDGMPGVSYAFAMTAGAPQS
jgi:HK97 family phage major capsid protein